MIITWNGWPLYLIKLGFSDRLRMDDLLAGLLDKGLRVPVMGLTFILAPCQKPLFKRLPVGKESWPVPHSRPRCRPTTPGAKLALWRRWLLTIWRRA